MNEPVSRSRRGTETRQRTELVNLRLTPDEQADLRARAASEGIPVATYIRRRVFAGPAATTTVPGAWRCALCGMWIELRDPCPWPNHCGQRADWVSSDQRTRDLPDPTPAIR